MFYDATVALQDLRPVECDVVSTLDDGRGLGADPLMSPGNHGHCSRRGGRYHHARGGCGRSCRKRQKRRRRNRHGSRRR
eukprot:2378385-Heterocapsa_arctica.AAC.1